VFEQVCNTALIRFPGTSCLAAQLMCRVFESLSSDVCLYHFYSVDHIQARKKELSQAAIEKAFGKGFVAKMMPK
jgi:hypothetical protein